MKLRILDSTIRLRLDRAEVDHLGAGRSLMSTTTFPGGGVFSYLLQTADTTQAAFEGGCITISVAEQTLVAWARDDQQVGISDQLPLASGQLSLLVEKDFECLEPRSGEDQSNRFVNPKA